MPVWFELLNFKSQILAISCHGLARLFRVIRRLWRQGQFSVTSSEGPPGLELSSFAPYRSAGDRLRKGAIRSEWSVAIFSRGVYSGRLSFKFNSITRSWLHMIWASNQLKISLKNPPIFNHWKRSSIVTQMDLISNNCPLFHYFVCGFRIACYHLILR